jgi:hypothetical protein
MLIQNLKHFGPLEVTPMLVALSSQDISKIVWNLLSNRRSLQSRYRGSKFLEQKVSRVDHIPPAQIMYPKRKDNPQPLARINLSATF